MIALLLLLFYLFYLFFLNSPRNRLRNMGCKPLGNVFKDFNLIVSNLFLNCINILRKVLLSSNPVYIYMCVCLKNNVPGEFLFVCLFVCMLAQVAAAAAWMWPSCHQGLGRRRFLERFPQELLSPPRGAGEHRKEVE